MTAWLLNLVYLALLAVASPWLIYQALRNGKYRDGWAERFLGRIPVRDSQRHCVWLHAVSLGEVNLLQTILERIEHEFPDWDVVISSTTATGYAQAKKKYAPRPVFYAPLDFSWAVNAVLQRLRPDLLLLAELEVWPNLLKGAKRHGVQVAVVNGRLGEKSFRGYRRWQWLLRSTFARLDLVAAQSEDYAARFRALGCAAERVQVTGSLKFDGAHLDRGNLATARLARLAGIAPDDIIFLAGSTQATEESVALDVFQRYAEAYPQLKLILVPRHPERFPEVAELLTRRGIAWQRRSELSEGEDRARSPGVAHIALQSGSTRGIGIDAALRSVDDSQNGCLSAAEDQTTASCSAPFASKRGYPRVLLVDAVGELGAWWGLAKIAFVGGSLGNRGGQNMIEPAAYGAAVCFGPNTWNFQDAVSLLLASDAAVVVPDAAALQRFVGRCLAEPKYCEELGGRAAALVRQQQGATEQTMRLLRPLLVRTESAVLRRIDAPKPPGPSRNGPAAARRKAV